MVKNYSWYTDAWHRQAEKNIDTAMREMRKYLNFLRNDLIEKNRLTQEEMNMYLNAILSDPICKKEITEWYKMKDLDERNDIVWNNYIEKYKEKPAKLSSLPCYRIDDKKKNTEEMKKIENIRKWFLEQKNKNSYKRDPQTENPKEFEKKYTDIVKEFDTRDVTLNQILEFSVRNLFEGMLENIKGKENITNIKVIKTNEYDDVLSKTDFIVEIEYNDGKKSYEAIDLTTSKDPNTIENKKYPEKVTCRNFCSIETDLERAIPRTVIVINDKEFLCQYLRAYMQQIQKKGKITSKDALKIRNNLWEKSQKIKKDIIEALTKNISLN